MTNAGCPIVLPRESESVLLGAAILGAVAAKKYTGVNEAMKALNAAGQVFFGLHISSMMVEFRFWLLQSYCMNHLSACTCGSYC